MVTLCAFWWLYELWWSVNYLLIWCNLLQLAMDNHHLRRYIIELHGRWLPSLCWFTRMLAIGPLVIISIHMAVVGVMVIWTPGGHPFFHTVASTVASTVAKGLGATAWITLTRGASAGGFGSSWRWQPVLAKERRTTTIFMAILYHIMVNLMIIEDERFFRRSITQTFFWP